MPHHDFKRLAEKSEIGFTAIDERERIGQLRRCAVVESASVPVRQSRSPGHSTGASSRSALAGCAQLISPPQKQPSATRLMGANAQLKRAT